MVYHCLPSSLFVEDSHLQIWQLLLIWVHLNCGCDRFPVSCMAVSLEVYELVVEVVSGEVVDRVVLLSNFSFHCHSKNY